MANQNLRGQYAGFVSRLVAFFIDLVIISISTIIITWVVTRPVQFLGIDISNCAPINTTGVISFVDSVWCHILRFATPIIAISIPILYPLILWTLTGQTIGKFVLGVKVVRVDGQPMTLFTSIRRLIGYIISLFFFGLGFVWILISNERRGWHDRLASTVVIYAWDARENDRFLGSLGRLGRRLSQRRQPENVPASLPDGQ